MGRPRISPKRRGFFPSSLSRNISALALLVISVLFCGQTSWNARGEEPARGVSQSGIKPRPSKQSAPGKLKAAKTKAQLAQADVALLAAEADQLRDALKKTNVYVLPLDAVQRTEAIERLAKKIEGEDRDR